jgi:hypothetical protein
VRIVSWNIAFRGTKAAKRQGKLLQQLAPDLILLQELNPGSSSALVEASGADWIVRSIDLRAPDSNDTPVRRRGVAIAGRGPPPRRSWLLNEIQLPERLLLIETHQNGTPFVAASYHAPPGVNWGIVKPRQAVAFASWLSAQCEPLLFGTDANTPLIDALEFANTRTHWHSVHDPIPRLFRHGRYIWAGAEHPRIQSDIRYQSLFARTFEKRFFRGRGGLLCPEQRPRVRVQRLDGWP